MLWRHTAGLPPPVSPFRPNPHALKLDISDEGDEFGVGPRLLATSNVGASPALFSLGNNGLGTPQNPPSDVPDESPQPSPRPRASTVAQNANAMHAALPPLTINRQFLRTTSQPASALGISPTSEQYNPDGVAPPRTGSLKRTFVSSASRVAPARPLSEVTPLNTRRPLLSASYSAHAGKPLSCPGNGGISPPRRVLVKDQPAGEPKMENEEREPQQIPYSIAPA
jgi:hypothetical protein